MKHFVALMILAIVVASSCTKKKNDYAISGDYLIVGHAGGFTTGGPTTYYLINNGQLRTDNTVSSAAPHGNVNDFKFNNQLSDAKYNEVKTLPSQVPAELLARNGQRIGEVFIDAGYTDVRYSAGGVAYRWYIEAGQDSSSAEVRRFIDSLQVVFR